MFTIDDIYNQVACLGANDGERTILQSWIYHHFQLPYLPYAFKLALNDTKTSFWPHFTSDGFIETHKRRQSVLMHDISVTLLLYLYSQSFNWVIDGVDIIEAEWFFEVAISTCERFYWPKPHPFRFQRFHFIRQAQTGLKNSNPRFFAVRFSSIYPYSLQVFPLFWTPSAMNWSDLLLFLSFTWTVPNLSPIRSYRHTRTDASRFRVGPLPGNPTLPPSHAGLIPISGAEEGNALFFWLFEAENRENDSNFISKPLALRKLLCGGF